MLLGGRSWGLLVMMRIGLDERREEVEGCGEE